MRSFSYDFHVHSCLSPCGDMDMTPNNIVNLAKMVECDILALTDHNSCKNTPAAIKAGEAAGLLVIPGMELCVAEEAHVVCLFEEVKAALEFDEYIYAHMPHVKNKAEVFGEQAILDENDERIGTEENLLLVSSFVTVNEVQKLVESYGGVAFPAHIDRDSFSVVASLGSIPEEADFAVAELTFPCSYEEMAERNPEIADKLILRSSDAHYLDTLAGEKKRIHLPELSRKAVIERIKAGKYHDEGSTAG